MYRWVRDIGENGGRIQLFQRAGYDLATQEEQLTVGQDSVFKTENIGSNITKPESDGSLLFLMKQKKEWYDEDQANKATALNTQFNEVKNSDNKNGHYGELKIK